MLPMLSQRSKLFITDLKLSNEHHRSFVAQLAARALLALPGEVKMCEFLPEVGGILYLI